ncbi:uncharacterized protein LY89DRAFT_736174 [Mollisia scopiformis]|uniref:Aminoglycoside phosphotransferase domain-containing protein n=1 Tax=Mollisia scopiformis TaxID=149040 RepID=A0A194X1Q0_MOLSC|nr:uncharacterized protein LY89DRAFT_736174 [Mollisia scopiformis]KUJ14126.1 hypothetical protein LY89DRAFT_736174 [Mollisia scopiformis]
MLPYAFKNYDTRLSQSRSLEAIKAAMPRFVSEEDITGPFKLLNRDFRLGNILVDKNWKITAVLDWVFSNVGPSQLAELFAWDDQEDMVKHKLEREFKNKFDAFILLVREEEDRRGMDDSFSRRMSQYLEDGTLWFNLPIEEYMIWEHLLERVC